MKKCTRFLIVIPIAISFVFLFTNCNYKTDGKQGNDSGKKKIDKILPVNFQIIKADVYDDNISLTGNLVSNEEVEIRSEITGKVISINFKEGTKVAKGALLVKINDDELQAQRKKLNYRLKLASDNEFRQKTLLEKNGTSKETYDIAYNELQLVNADIELLDAQIRKTEIHAPFTGVIGLRYISIGSYITPQTKIANLQSINPIKAEFNIPQKYQSIFTANQTIEILTHTSKKYQGRVFASESKLDASSRSLLVRALISNNDNLLKPGEFVTVNMPVSASKNAIMIPSMTLVPDIKGETVFIYRSGIAVQTLVKPGNRTAEEVEIFSGLNAGDTLITSGIIQLRNKMPVSLKTSSD